MSTQQHTGSNNWVTVITPTYNRAHLIIKTLDSVWAQTYRPIEVLIIDDGSTDDTKRTVRLWSDEHDKDGSFRTRYIYQDNAGAPAARNNGIIHARGKYLQFLDSDDLLLPQKFTLQIEMMKQENTPLCIVDYLHIDEKGNVITTARKDFTIDELIKNFISVHTSGPLLDQSYYADRILKWNENIPKKQDKDFFMKILMTTDKISYINKFLFKWVRHQGEERITFSKIELRVIYRKLLKSFLVFSLKNYKLIPREKRKPIMRLYKKLFRRSFGPLASRMLFWRAKRK
jgi:glycosyltransferase involved in cell wall biosynthesis